MEEDDNDRDNYFLPFGRPSCSTGLGLRVVSSSLFVFLSYLRLPPDGTPPDGCDGLNVGRERYETDKRTGSSQLVHKPISTPFE